MKLRDELKSYCPRQFSRKLANDNVDYCSPVNRLSSTDPYRYAGTVAIQRGFAVLWTASSLSNLADGVAFVSVPLIAASLTQDPRLIAGLSLCYAAVRLLLALPSGVWVDRFDRRTLLSCANILRGIALLSLASSFYFCGPNLLALYLAMAFIAVLEGTADTAAFALLPQLVSPEKLDQANSKITATQLITDEFAGPPLGGFLFAFAAAIPLYSMGGLWAVAGTIALALPRSARPAVGSGEHQRIWVEAGDGIRWLMKHRLVGALAMISGLASIGYMMAFSILVLFAKERLGLDSTGYGLLLAFSALGGLAGSAITPRLRRILGYRNSILGSLALGSLSLGILAISTTALLAGLMLALYIMHAVICNVCSLSLRQRLVPEQLMGRVSAASRVLGLAGLALGSVAGGLLGSINLTAPVVAGSCVFALCMALAWLRIGKEPEVLTQ